jgi:hypothetical protein
VVAVGRVAFFVNRKAKGGGGLIIKGNKEMPDPKILHEISNAGTPCNKEHSTTKVRRASCRKKKLSAY